MAKRRNIFNVSLTSGVKLHIYLWNVIVRFIFSSILQIWYVEIQISRSCSESIGLWYNGSAVLRNSFQSGSWSVEQGDMMHLVDRLPCFMRETNFVTSCLLLLKKGCYKRNAFSPKGEKIHSILIIFWQGGKNNFDKLSPLNVFPFPLNFIKQE